MPSLRMHPNPLVERPRGRQLRPCEAPIDRREFLRLAGLAALACAIESCTNKTPSRTPSPGVSGVPASSGPPASLNPTELKDLDALARSLGDRLIRPSDPRFRNAAQLYSTRF